MDDITKHFVDKTPKNPKDSLRRKYLLRKRYLPYRLSEFILFSESLLEQKVYVNKNKVKEIKKLLKKSKELLDLFPKRKELSEEELINLTKQVIDEQDLIDTNKLLKEMKIGADEVFQQLLEMNENEVENNE